MDRTMKLEANAAGEENFIDVIARIIAESMVKSNATAKEEKPTAKTA